MTLSGSHLDEGLKADYGGTSGELTELQIDADISATSITARCFIGEESPPLSLLATEHKLGVSEVSQRRKGSGWDLPVGAAPTNLVLQAPPWSEVQQRGPQHSPVTLQALHNRRRDQPRDYSSNTGIFPPRSLLLSPISKSLSSALLRHFCAAAFKRRTHP